MNAAFDAMCEVMDNAKEFDLCDLLCWGVIAYSTGYLAGHLFVWMVMP